MVAPLSRPSSVDLLIDQMRTAIVAGVLRPGADLNATHLSEAFGVSHIPIREALRALEREGLVTLRSQKKARVAEIHGSDVTDVYRLRILLEGEVIERAAARYIDADLEEIERLYESMGSTNSDADLAAHDAFHRALVAPEATLWEIRVLNILWNASERHLRVLFAAFEPGDAHYEHQHLLDCARRRDGEGLRTALTGHLRKGESLLMDRAAPYQQG